MDTSTSVFGRLRTRGQPQPKEDEWYIPYKPTSSTQPHQGGIGFSPPPQRSSQSHNILSFLSTGTSAPSDDYPGDRSFRFPSRAPYSTISRTQLPTRPGPPGLAKSPSYNSLNNMVPLAARIPSSTSVPTGLQEPRMLFSPLNREIRASLVQPLPDDVSHRIATTPRTRTVSGPEPRRRYPASQAPPTRWAASTLCDMIVFPRPSILPHTITPPGSPDAQRTAWESAVVEEARRIEEREAWANYVRHRGRSMSFGASGKAPRDAPIIGSYRVRSREHSQDRPRPTEEEGRKRSNSLSARLGRLRSRSDAGRRGESTPPTPKAAQTIGRAAPRRPSNDAGPSFVPFLTMTAGDRDDRYRAALPPNPTVAPTEQTARMHHATQPDLRAAKRSTSPRIRSQPLKSLRIVPAVHENRGDVVIIGPKSIPKRRSSLPRGELDFGKPLPHLPPSSSHRNSTPRLGLEDFEPLSQGIDREMSLRSIASSQLEPPAVIASVPLLPRVPAESKTRTDAPAVAAAPAAALRSSVSSSTQDGASGQAHARSVLAKQHQRALNRKAFAAPVPATRGRGRDSTPTQSALRASVRSANSVYSQPDFALPASSSRDQVLPAAREPVAPPPTAPIAEVSPPASQSSSQGTPGPLRKTTAMEDAIHRSRAGSVGNVETATPTAAAAKSGLKPRPRTADSDEREGEVTPRPAPSFSSNVTPSTVRKAAPPPLNLARTNHRAIASSSGFSRLPSPLSPPLHHPISIVPSPRLPYGFEPSSAANDLRPPTRPDLLHASSKASGMTVYTDASEGWDRDLAEVPPQEEPLENAGRKEESPDSVPSPDPNPDQDFQDLFFRTPYDPGSSPPSAYPRAHPYRDVIPPLPTQDVIGLGYDLPHSHSDPSMPKSTSWPTVSSPRSSRPISSGTLSGDSELATPLLFEFRNERRPQITYADGAHSHPHPPPSNSSNATLVSKHLMDGYADRRESGASAGGSSNAHAHPPHPPAAIDGSPEALRKPEPELSGNDNRRGSAIDYSPTTFGISLPTRRSSSPPFPPPDHSPPNPPAMWEPLREGTPPPRPHRKSATFLHTTPPGASTVGSPSSDVLHARSSARNSAAVSFMSEFPTPPELHAAHFSSGEVLRIRGGSGVGVGQVDAQEHESAFGQVVTGPPGAGKTTYCYGMYQLLTALHRPVHIINLDPAVPNPPYPCAINITELITLDEVMEEHGLGPNGAMLYCVEHLEENFDWLVERLDEVLGESSLKPTGDPGVEGDGGGQEAYVIFDTPGQVELWTNHESLRNVIERLGKLDYRLAGVHLSDAHYITDASKFISVTLLAMRAMLALELPHINVLSKIDLLAQYGPLPFDLKYYTQAQDLHHLLSNLDEAGGGGGKMKKLNRALVELVEQYGLVHWETCAVEDKKSMLHLLRVLDLATGYVYLPAASSSADGIAAMLGTTAGEMPGWDVDDVQERWIDHKEEWDAVEREMWKAEGEARRALTRPPGEDAEA